MAVQNFPDSPTNGTIYGGWKWDGNKWVANPGVYLPLAGGSMTGELVLVGNATLPLGAVTLQQMNTALANAVPLLPLTVGQGGTGAATAPAARVNLGVDKVPIVYCFPQTPVPGSFLNVPIARPLVLKAGLSGSQIYASAISATAAATAVFQIRKISGGANNMVGQINLAAGPVWTFVLTADVSLNAGDVLQLQYLMSGVTAVTDLANVSITILADRV